MQKGTLCFLFVAVQMIFFQGFSQTYNALDSDGKRHGVWQKKFEGSNQIRYQGTFEHGKEIGEFKFYKPNSGNQPTAIKYFSKESDTVLVKYFTQKGSVISKGKMIGKNRVGLWQYYHSNSDKIMMTEEYVAGEMEGEQRTYFPNGQLTELTYYKQGKKEGKRVVYSDAGILIKEFVYVADKMNGLAKYYDAKGKVKIEGNYKMDRKDGIWKYYKDGKLTEQKKFPLYNKKKN